MRPIHFEVGTSFTMAVTDDLNVHAWGINDCHQLGKGIQDFKHHYAPEMCRTISKFNPRVISCGDDHTAIIDYKNDVYIWGNNSQGQLGLGHPRTVNAVVKVTALGKNLQTIQCKGKHTFAVTGDGNILKWPNEESHCKFSPMMVMKNDPWAKFQNISLGCNFAIGLTTNGLLLSYGVNDRGQLGHGDYINRKEFILIEQLKENGDKMKEVSCGNKHAIARTANGKIYTWGMGFYGQLGTGEDTNQKTPVMIQLTDPKMKNIKALSAQAGYNSSYILYENRKVFSAGTNAYKQSNNFTFRRLKFEDRVYDSDTKKHVMPIKLYCKWSKSLNLCYLEVGDFRKVNETKIVREKIVNHINLTWEECYHQVLPPYEESIAKHVCAKYIKKINKLPKSIPKSQLQETYKENYNLNEQDIEESKIVQKGVNRSKERAQGGQFETFDNRKTQDLKKKGSNEKNRIKEARSKELDQTRKKKLKQDTQDLLDSKSSFGPRSESPVNQGAMSK